VDKSHFKALKELPRDGDVSQREICLAVTVDTECDKGPGWTIQRPLRFRSVTEAIPGRLEPIFHEHGARGTYLLSPEVIRDEASALALRSAGDNGAELGAHLHGEFIGGSAEEEAGVTWEMQSSLSAAEEEEKLTALTDLFEKTFGRKPTSFRAGRYGIGANTLPALARLGYTVDSSVVPYTRWKDRGGEVSFFGCPVEPYAPAAADPLREGALPILEVPVTMGDTLWEKVPRPLLRTVTDYSRLWNLPINLLGLKERFRPVWLRPTWSTAEEMESLIRKKAGGSGKGPVVLVMMFHSVEFQAGCAPASVSEGAVEEFCGRLGRVLEFVRGLGGRFVTLAEVPSIVGEDAG
jgi:hypothetical protein